MKAFYVVVALVIASQSAQAWEIRTNCSYSRFYGASSCRMVGTDEALPRDHVQDAEDLKLKQERIKKWEAFCKPASVQDRYGVARLVYAHENCDLGRSQ
jgi:hypothetical protein